METETSHTVTTAWLEQLLQEIGVPGVAVGILKDGELETFVAGKAHVVADVEVTPDTVFPIASISKMWTATAFMQLVGEGAVELDASVSDVLPEVRFERTGPPVTFRHFLNHTSGIDGDFFDYGGRGEDALERYAIATATLPSLIPAGSVFSYGNAGINVIGHAIARLRGTTWEQAMQEHLLGPGGFDHTVVLPEDALMLRTAVGHMRNDAGEYAPTGLSWTARANAPAGGVACSVEDLLRFAEVHLNGGRAANGTQLLPAELVAEMQRSQIEVPDPRSATAWGLTWSIFEWGDTRIIAHEGGRAGIASYLFVIPEKDVAFAVLTNGGEGSDLMGKVIIRLLRELAGVEIPSTAGPIDTVDEAALDNAVGTYRRSAWELEVVREGDHLLGTLHIEPPLSIEKGTDTLSYVFRPSSVENRRLFLARYADKEAWHDELAFFDVPGVGRYVHMWTRSVPRVDE